MKRFSLFITGMFLTSMFLTSIVSVSQIIDYKKDKFWIDRGLGCYSSNKNNSGSTKSFGVSLNKGYMLYKAKFVMNTEWDFFIDHPQEKFFNVGCLLGMSLESKNIQTDFSGGIGITSGIRRGKYLYTEEGDESLDIADVNYYEKKTFFSPSILYCFDIIYKPVKHAGIGLSYLGDLNLRRPTKMIILTLTIGKLK